MADWFLEPGGNRGRGGAPRGRRRQNRGRGENRGNRRGGDSRGGRARGNGRRDNYDIPERNGGQRREVHPLSYNDVVNLSNKLKSGEILSGSIDLMRAVTALSFKKRLDEIWDHDESTGMYLHIILKAISHVQTELFHMTQEFIDDVLKSKLLEDVANKHIMILIGKATVTKSKQEILQNYTELMIAIIQKRPSAYQQVVARFGILNMVTPQFAGKDAKLTTSHDILTNLVINTTTKQNEMITANDEEKKKKRQVQESEGLPPEPFREVSVCPTAEDLLIVGKPYLRKNIVKGPYNDSEHYLDVQYRLLREDFVAPLREGVLSHRNAHANGSRDTYVYQNARINIPELDKRTKDISCPVFFRPRARCRWIKQLIYGSLVVLSRDGFEKDFIFGTVQNRDVRQLQQGRVNVVFELESYNRLNHNAEYRMIESSAYFEAYRHVLRGMQSIAPNEPVPLHRYLVEMNTTTALPGYMRRNGHMMNFSKLTRKPDQMIDVRRAHEHLTPAQLHLDISQFRALTMAFQQELVVIQGPPGTGKTYLALQIARVLLANKTQWNPDKRHPMLVVCLTNHALDQFLNGILKFMHEDNNGRVEGIDLIRIGSRCKDENMQRHMLHEVKKEYRCFVPSDVRARQHKAYDKRDVLIIHIDKLAKSLRALKFNVVSLHEVLADSHVSTPHLQQFKQYMRQDMTLDDVFVEWLTRFRRPERTRDQENRMDLKVVEKLMHTMGYKERLAKNLALICENNYDLAANYAWQHPTVDLDELDDRVLPQNRHWPSVAAMRELMRRHPIVEEDAYDVLTKNQGNDNNATAAILANGLGQMDIQEAQPQPAAAVVQGDDVVNREIQLLAEYERERGFDEMADDENFDEEDRLRNAVKAERHKKPRIYALLGGEGWKQGTVPSQREERQEKLTTAEKRIVDSVPLEEHRARRVADVWEIALPVRWQLYKYWVRKELLVSEALLKTLEHEFSGISQDINVITKMGDAEILRQAKVIGMTTTGAARLQSVLRTIQCPVVIVEEAAEILEPHIVTALSPNAQQVIMIGDHKQLRPNLEVYELAKNYQFDVSLFERLVNNNYPYATLKNQHRMRTEIARTLMPHFYDELDDDPSVFKYEPILGMQKSFAFVNHAHKEKIDQEQKSHLNEFEANYAVRLALYLLQQGYKADQITILCTYMEQMLTIRRIAPDVIGQEHKVRIDVVDNYQGEECDIIILSLVRSLNPANKIGFLNTPNRVCVAMSRAKKGFYVLGNIDFLADRCTAIPNHWKNIRNSLTKADALSNNLVVVCQNHKNAQMIAKWEDFYEKTSEGGCREPCGTRLDCGHTCPSRCHPTSHDKFNCMETCGRTCSNGHGCNKRCSEACDKCTITINAVLKCGHQTTKPCHLDLERVKCRDPCPNVLACGHRCASGCSAPCTISCLVKVAKKMSCGHSMLMSCCDDPLKKKCSTKVTKSWPNCRHNVVVECHVDTTRTDCPHPCGAQLPDCKHTCKGRCGDCRQGRLHVRCDEICTRTLVCGHECGSMCSVSCPPCQKPCETACFHSRCNSNVQSQYQSQKCRTIHQGRGKQKGRTCGEMCPPCLEECPNRCHHPCTCALAENEKGPRHNRFECAFSEKRVCGKKCKDVCSLESCDKRCVKKLKPCGHRCVGLCQEDCPKICRECPEDQQARKDYEEAAEIFFGAEDDDDALFIQLPCGHCIESSGMDGWVNSLTNPSGEEGAVSAAIVQITCPKCKSFVTKSRRYQRQLNQRIKDIEIIKGEIRGGTVDVLTAKCAEVTGKLRGLMIREAVIPVRHRTVITAPPPAAATFKEIIWPEAEDIITVIVGVRQLTKELVVKQENIFEFMSKLKDIQEKIKALPPTNASVVCLRLQNALKLFFGTKNFVEQLNKEWTFMLSYLKKHLLSKDASNLMFEQYKNELVRLERWYHVAHLLNQVQRNGGLDEKAAVAVDKLHLLLNSNIEATEKTREEFRALMNTINSNFGLTLEEELIIQKAVANDVSAWYKCPNGHLYAIGECGMAMQQSTCPTCKATIGGAQHRSAAGNTRVEAMSRRQEAVNGWD